MRKRQERRSVDNDPEWAAWNITRAEKAQRESSIDPDWWHDLNHDQQYALDCIRAAYILRTKEARLRLFDPQRKDRTYAVETADEERLQVRYVEWWKRCAGRGWGMARIHGLIVDPMTPREQVGPVLGLICKALDEYLRIR